jgi:hypothetical protein
MKVLCPRCNQAINLGYLEKVGSQMACCPGCNTVVAASYKKDDNRANWKLEIETPQSENNDEEGGCGCGAAILILIGLLILFATVRSEPEVPDILPDDAPAEEVRN